MKAEDWTKGGGVIQMVQLYLAMLSMRQCLILFVVCLLTAWFLKRKWDMSILARLGFDGPEPNFFLGSIHTLRKDVLNKQIEWLEKYGKKLGRSGKTMGFYRGPAPSLLTTNINIMKEAFIKDVETFTNRPVPGNDRTALHLLFLTDHDWKRVRRILTPAFSAAKMRKMCGTMNRAINIALEQVEKHVKKNEPCDFYRLFQGLTLDVIGETALAMKVECQRNPADPLLVTARKLFQQPIPPTTILATMFPILSRLLQPLHQLTATQKAQRDIGQWVHQVVEERKKNPDGRKTIDMLQLMLDASEEQDKDASEPKTVDISEKSWSSLEKKAGVNEPTEALKTRDVTIKYMADKEVVDNAVLFLLAGYETTSTALSFTAYLLALNPDIQEKLSDEIKLYMPDGQSEPDSDTVAKMKYLDQVLQESMRIYPPVPGILGRECKEMRVIDGVKIPAGCSVFIPIWALHHDPELWHDPWKFDPDRFSVENQKKIKAVTYIPFGEGPRKCIGARFAFLEAKLTLVQLLNRYRLAVCDQTEEDITVKSKGLSLMPVSGKIMLITVPRKME